VSIRQPLVAVVLDTYGDFQHLLADAVRERLAGEGFGTLAIASRELASGSAFKDSLEFSENNSTHAYLKRLNVAGVVVCSSTILHAMKGSELSDFIAGFHPAPVVSLGLEIPDVVSVTVDTSESLLELMRHMTQDPKRRRFVFIRGFAESMDSLERERVFRQVLAERGLEVDESLIIDGDFVSSVARNRIIDLLDRGSQFDAVVAVNDTMAVSAIIALQGKGIKVPEQVIVSGFDDSPDASASFPSVTTVRQRFALQASTAADQLLRMIKGDADSVRSVVLGSDLIVRESSNASGSWSIDAQLAKQNKESAENLDAMILETRGLVGDLTNIRVPQGVNVDQLVNAFKNSMSTGSDELAEVIEQCLFRAPVSSNSVGWWRQARQKLLHRASRLPPEQVDPSAIAPLSQASEKVGLSIFAAQARFDVDRARYREIHDRLLLSLAQSTSRENIAQVLGSGFHYMGMRRAWLVQLDPTVGACDLQLRLTMSLLNGQVSLQQITFDADRILPALFDHEARQDSLVLQPLISEQGLYGFLLLDPHQLDQFEFESIAVGISQAFRQVDQLNDLKKKAHELQHSNAALAQIARYDSLTGLPNRALFHENLEHAFAMAERSRGRVALLFFDLDGFKMVNDTLGHSAGDELLKSVSKRLQGILRRADQLARLGGDEFTVIANEIADGQAATRIAQQVHETLLLPVTLFGHQVRLSASIGIAYFPSDGQDAETLIRNADTAMYHAKMQGKNCHVFYTSEMSTKAIEHMQVDADILMHYQPRFDISGKRLIAVEALMRWKKDQGASDESILEPGKFIPIAEQTGFISELDAFALESVCRQASQWVAEGTPVVVSVNLSVKFLQDENIVSHVESALQRYSLEAKWIELEITESAAMTDFDANVAKLEKFRVLGCRVAIDDFGTGYSSLSYLKKLPVSTLKIDRSFIADIGNVAENSADFSIVKAVIALGHSLNFTVVAEGVENQSQLQFLESASCDQAQGFYLSKPLPASQLAHLLHQSVEGDVAQRQINL